MFAFSNGHDMRIKKSVFILGMLAGCIFPARAQQTRLPYLVEAIVRDSAVGKPVAYATIGISDTAGHAIAATNTLENGTFKTALPGPGSYRLEISAVGYKTRELTVAAGEGRYGSGCPA